MIYTRKITITQAKPNPAGKDRLGGVTPSSQLAGEWIDFKNTGDESFNLENIKLYHIAYTLFNPNGVWTKVMGFSGALGAGYTIRVHSGGTVPLTTLNQIDVQGAEFHLFTGENYVWNNNKSDSPRLKDVSNNSIIDEATYATYPAEGRILKRQGNALI